MNILRKLSIRTQLIIISVSTIMVMLLIIYFSYYAVANMVTKKNSMFSQGVMHQIQTTETANMDVLNRIATNIAYNTSVQQYLTSSNYLEKFELLQTVNNFLFNLQGLKDGILNIVVLGNQGDVISLNGGVQTTRQLAGQLPNEANAHYYGISKIDLGSTAQYCFVVGMRIYAIDPLAVDVGNKQLGSLYVFVDAGGISGLSNMNGGTGNDQDIFRQTDTKFYLLDRNHAIFASNDDRFSIGTRVPLPVSEADKRQYDVQIQEVPEMGGTIVGLTPKKALLSDLVNIRRAELFIFIMGLLLLLIPFSYVIRNILQPLNKLMSFMKTLRLGDLEALKNRITLHGYAEMSVMANDFNGMLDKIDKLTNQLLDVNKKLYEVELVKKQSELAMLRSQINPHFLYNTLESIKGLAAIKGVPEIMDMAKSLGLIFRYSIKGEQMVSFREELRIVESYVQIQKVRFADRFTVSYSIEEDVLDSRVPKMILQPIIENAIYHGLEPKVGRGHLQINGRIGSERDLVVIVKDDGVGIDHDVLEEMRKYLAEPTYFHYTGQHGMGLGIINVNHRLKLEYGENSGLSITSRLGEGTEVRIRIPMEDIDV